MANDCLYPLRGYRGPGGRVSFKLTEGYIDLPVEVRCGQCIHCRLERSRQWAVRLTHEKMASDESCFITLTYDDENIPEDFGLVVEHTQAFWKRLRQDRIRNAKRRAKRSGTTYKAPERLRYFLAGEYGETTSRPHYHACLFGDAFADDRVKYGVSKSGHPIYTSQRLDRLWRHGSCKIGELTFESAAYVAQYVTKKLTDDDLLGGRKPEFCTMSRRPGIGKTFYDKHKDQFYPRDEVVLRGKRMTPPKRYDQWYEEEIEKGEAKLTKDQFENIKTTRATKAQKYAHDQTPERRVVREACAKARARQFSREPRSD